MQVCLAMNHQQVIEFLSTCTSVLLRELGGRKLSEIQYLSTNVSASKNVNVRHGVVTFDILRNDSRIFVAEKLKFTPRF